MMVSNPPMAGCSALNLSTDLLWLTDDLETSSCFQKSLTAFNQDPKGQAWILKMASSLAQCFRSSLDQNGSQGCP